MFTFSVFHFSRVHIFNFSHFSVFTFYPFHISLFSHFRFFTFHRVHIFRFHISLFFHISMCSYFLFFTFPCVHNFRFSHFPAQVISLVTDWNKRNISSCYGILNGERRSWSSEKCLSLFIVNKWPMRWERGRRMAEWLILVGFLLLMVAKWPDKRNKRRGWWYFNPSHDSLEHNN